MFPVSSQREAKQIATRQKSSRRAPKQIALILRSQSPSLNEADRRRCDCILPGEFRTGVISAGQHIETRECILRRVGNQSRRPAQLLKISRAIGRFDLFVLCNAADWSNDLDPATVETRRHAVDFVTAIIAVFFSPEISG